ncbi:hypothetical protein [Anabaena sp. CS-542/02]|nr:hypothetical protein [Anabaena sp. CS-542/02]MDB9446191.1 hypothetical protein [Anabaena sp. CS-542/02]
MVKIFCIYMVWAIHELTLALEMEVIFAHASQVSNYSVNSIDFL